MFEILYLCGWSVSQNDGWSLAVEGDKLGGCHHECALAHRPWSPMLSGWLAMHTAPCYAPSQVWAGGREGVIS